MHKLTQPHARMHTQHHPVSQTNRVSRTFTRGVLSRMCAKCPSPFLFVKPYCPFMVFSPGYGQQQRPRPGLHRAPLRGRSSPAFAPLQNVVQRIDEFRMDTHAHALAHSRIAKERTNVISLPSHFYFLPRFPAGLHKYTHTHMFVYL